MGGLGLGGLLLLLLLGLLLGLGLGGSLSGNSGSLDRIGGDISSSSLNGGGLSAGLSSRSLNLSNGGLDGLGDLLLLLLAEEVAKDGSALAAGRAALGLLLLGSLLLLLLGLLRSRLGNGGLGGGSSLLGGGSSLDSGGLSSSDSLLLLLGRSRLQALKSLLVGLGLGDGGSKLLGLGNLGLDLGNPVVTLSSARSLEGVLLALGAEVELLGAVGGRLRGIGLQNESAEELQTIHIKKKKLTRWMAPWGAALSPFSL